MSIQTLYFGKDSAEEDFIGGGLLQNSFLQTSLYEEIKSGTKALVIGRKGSGKSALCLMLNKNLSAQRDNASRIVTPDEISGDEIHRFETTGVNLQQAKKLVWRYILLVSICKFLVSVARQKYKTESEWPLEIEKVRQFLVANREVDDLNFPEKFWVIINRIRSNLKFDVFGQLLEVSLNDAQTGLQLGTQLDFLENHLLSSLTQLPEKKLYILIDKVDEIWNDNSSSDIAVGLLMAAKDINAKFSNVRCVVFLRSDIYEQLYFADKDKLRSSEENVLWTNLTLPDLILTRAQMSTGKVNMTSNELWSVYFPTNIGQMPTLNFILSHTLMRPRDLIQLCNKSVDLARREGSNSVLEEHVLQAIKVYSGWKLNDLINEYRVNYPFLNDVLILFSNTSFVLRKDRLASMYNGVKMILENRYPDPGDRRLLTMDSVLNILYGICFLGIERGRRILYYYDAPGIVEDGDTTFVIHPAFRYALSSISSVDMRQFQPGGEIRRQMRHQSEIYRGRKSGREEFEKSPSIHKEIKYFSSRLEELRANLSREMEVPIEVVSEISRNLTVILSDLEEFTIFSTPDVVQSHGIMTRIEQYLSDLKDKLMKNGYLSNKLSRRIQELMENTDEIMERSNRYF